MKARQILRHSIRQVIGNLPAALRISGVLYVVQWGVALALGLAATKTVGTVTGDEPAMLAALKALFLPALGALVVVIGADLWIAVAWHRYVLKVEARPGLLPAFDGRRMLGYLGAGLAVAGILVLPALLLTTAILGPLSPNPASPGAIILTVAAQVAVQTVIGAFAFRLSTVLAGVALEPGHQLAEGWIATRGETATFMEMTFYCALVLAGLDLFEAFVLPPLLPLQLAWGFVVQWGITMTGISILTTLYGHYIQKRPLI